MIFEVTKKKLPKRIEEEMKVWRGGFSSLPSSYITFHMELAQSRLEVLKKNYGIKVHATDMISDGWGDGMQVRQAIIETKSGELRKLKWMDANQDFGVQKIGTSMLFEKDLA
jgi:hypothetical protein